jgi:hypothetical protein
VQVLGDVIKTNLLDKKKLLFFRSRFFSADIDSIKKNKQLELKRIIVSNLINVEYIKL